MLVKVRASGINPSDVKNVAGHFNASCHEYLEGTTPVCGGANLSDWTVEFRGVTFAAGGPDDVMGGLIIPDRDRARSAAVAAKLLRGTSALSRETAQLVYALAVLTVFLVSI